MSDLVNRINKFLEKQMKVDSIEEAKKYGINISPEAEASFKTPKWQGDKTQPQMHAQATGESAPVADKVPKTKLPKIKHSRAKKPKPVIPSKYHYQRIPVTAGEEVAAQLTPKGPGYHSIEDVAQDVKESRRLANRLAGKKDKVEEE
jgi:hypothetical protein